MNMNMDNLTLSKLKEINDLFGKNINESVYISPLIDKYVIVRTYSAGVHAGTLVSKNDKNVVLSGSRRLWSWGSDNGVALSGVAIYGLSKDKKIDTKVDLIELTEAIEVILCSSVANKSINEY